MVLKSKPSTNLLGTGDIRKVFLDGYELLCTNLELSYDANRSHYKTGALDVTIKLEASVTMTEDAVYINTLGSQDNLESLLKLAKRPGPNNPATKNSV
jgi:hypothetical protein